MNHPLLGRLRSGYLYIALLFVICFALGACHEQRQDSGRVAVTTTIAPAASLIQAIGGELVSVTTLLPKGNNPENYEPTPRDIQSLSQSRGYFYIGDLYSIPTARATSPTAGCHSTECRPRTPA